MGAHSIAAAAAAVLLVAPARGDLADVVPPHVTTDTGVTYPEQAIHDGVAAPTTVTLRLAIDARGVVTEATLEEPRGHGFDEAALEAARRLRFTPATRDGIPVAARIRFQYVFTPPPRPRPRPRPHPRHRPRSRPTPRPRPHPHPPRPPPPRRSWSTAALLPPRSHGARSL